MSMVVCSEAQTQVVRTEIVTGECVLEMGCRGQGPMELYGLDDKVDVMIEAKCKERALLRFREAQAAGPTPDTQMAVKFL